MLAQGRSAVLSFTVDVKNQILHLEITSKRCLSKERVLGDRTLFLCVPYHKAKRFKTFPSMGSVNLSPFKAKAKTGRAT
jgi:hypothetical protein